MDGTEKKTRRFHHELLEWSGKFCVSDSVKTYIISTSLSSCREMRRGRHNETTRTKIFILEMRKCREERGEIGPDWIAFLNYLNFPWIHYVESTFSEVSKSANATQNESEKDEKNFHIKNEIQRYSQRLSLDTKPTWREKEQSQR